MLGVLGVGSSGSLPFVARGHHWIVDSRRYWLRQNIFENPFYGGSKSGLKRDALQCETLNLEVLNTRLQNAMPEFYNVV